MPWDFKVLLVRVKFKWNNIRATSSSLHRLVGVWAMLFNIILFFTGFWMNMFSLQPSYWAKQKIIPPKNQLTEISADKLLIAANRAIPALEIKNVYLPTQPGKNFRISGVVGGQPAIFGNGSMVIVDSKTAQVKEIQRFEDKTFSEKIADTVFPIHTGCFGNFLVKLFYVVMGLMPGLLSITGAILWWRRKRYHLTANQKR